MTLAHESDTRRTDLPEGPANRTAAEALEIIISLSTHPKADLETVGGSGANHLAARYFYLAVGVVINSFAISLITKCALGTSPISSVAYVLSLAIPSLSFGLLSFIINTVLILLQIVLLRRDFQPVQLLQMVVNIVFSYAIDVSMALLSFYSPEGIVLQALGVLFGCAVLAFGVCVEVAPQVITVPGEGVVRAIAQVSGKRFGTIKVFFDVTLVAIALVLSFVFFGEIRGLGLGTIISAFMVGRFCNFFNTYFKPLNKIRALTR